MWGKEGGREVREREGEVTEPTCTCKMYIEQETEHTVQIFLGNKHIIYTVAKLKVSLGT